MFLKWTNSWARTSFTLCLAAASSASSALAYESTCDDQCRLRVDQKLSAANELERQQQYEAAAKKYAEVIAEEPLSIISLVAARRAGSVLEKAEKFIEALTFYETAISIANARSDEQGVKSVVLKRNKRDALFERAGALRQAGNDAAAALAYQQAVDTVFADLAAEPPSATMRQDSAVNLQLSGLEAAVFLEEHGDPDRAMILYDQVIAIGDARADTADGENIVLMLNAKRDALLRKAGVCQQAGQADIARQAIQRLRAEYPVALQTVQAGVIEARLNGQSTQAAEQIVAQELQAQPILDEALRLSEIVAGNVDAIYPVSCSAGVDGTIVVQFKIKAGQGVENFWNIWIDDPAGKNLARWYGSGATARGRIGTTSVVTEQTVQLTGQWDEFQVKIRPAADQTEFLFNGESLSVLNHQITGAGSEVGRVRLERIDNPLAERGLLQIDDLTVSGGGNVNACLTESFAYSDRPLNGAGDWTGSADREIEILDGALRFNGRRYARYEQSLVLLDRVITDFPNTAATLVALEKKARVLGNLNRFDEAQAAFTSVLDRLRPTAARSEFFQTARVRLKRLISEHLIYETTAGRPTAEEKWDELRALCTTIITDDARPDERAQALVTIAESYSWQNKPAESLGAAEQFLGQYDANQFPYQTAWARLYAGIALQGLSRHVDALVHLRWLVESAKIEATNSAGKKILSHACSLILLSLQETQAPREEIDRAVSDCQRKFAGLQ